MSTRLFMNFVGFFFFKQKTAYEMRISDWSSDVCSSDLEDSTLHDGSFVAFLFRAPAGRVRSVRPVSSTPADAANRSRVQSSGLRAAPHCSGSGFSSATLVCVL